MCGITGIVDLRGARPIDRDLLTRMNESQHHRGPDGGGLHLEPGVGLGHRRLSIIDVATGQQPLYNEDGSVVVVFNGEIYNYQALMPELSRARPRLPHEERHRGDRPRVGSVGRALRRALPRHVRVRALGPQSSDAVPRARPAGREAAALRVACRTARCSSAPSSSRCWRTAASSATIDPLRDRGVFRARLRRRAAHDLRRCAQAAAGAYADACAAARPPAEPSCYWDPRFTLDRVLTARRGAGGAASRVSTNRCSCA